jgi:hypothetical protein
LRKAAEFVRGRAWVCGRAPAPGATGTAAVGDACGVALCVGAAVRVGVADDGDPVTVVLAAGADGDGAGGPPHPVSTAPAMSIASGACRDNLMPPTPPRPVS